ncbi:MAG: hypothetical protein KatS3mg059_1188 [Thermomicrobiales bacterium]|nr:MAG: hypothetical protein KatS3mg059_1188 [Thermomicrobiales bacterium]
MRGRNTSYRGFFELLKESLEHYRGELDDVVLVAPDYFRFLTNLLEDGRVSREARLLICAALAYIVAPYDVNPEEIYGPVGYLDDVFVCAHVTRELCARVPAEVLEEAWEAEFDLTSTTARVYAKTVEQLGERAADALAYVGLQ